MAAIPPIVGIGKMASAAIPGALNALGSVFGFSSAKSQAKKEYQRQKEFAQNQIQWRVKDAEAAGIHPLYALGAQGVSYAPQSAGGLDLGLGDMGQDISRAVLANRDRRDQMELQTWEMNRARAADAMALEKHQAELGLIASETELNRSQAARNAQAQLGPGVPRLTSAPAGSLAPLPSTPIVGSVGAPGQQPGAITEVMYQRGNDGGLRPTYSDDTLQRTQDDIFNQIGWHYRNTLMPGLGMNLPPNPELTGIPPPPGKQWRWSWWSQAWFAE